MVINLSQTTNWIAIRSTRTTTIQGLSCHINSQIHAYICNEEIILIYRLIKTYAKYSRCLSENEYVCKLSDMIDRL